MTVSDSVDLLIERRDDRRWDGRARASGERRRRRGAAADPGRGRAASRERRPPDRCHRPGRRARLHRPAQPRRPDDPGRAAPRAQGPPGRHDRDRRRRWQRLRAIFQRSEDLEAFVELDSGLDGRPAIDYDWDSVGRYLERFDGTVSVNVGTLVGNSALRIAALGWDDVPADGRAMDRMREHAPRRDDRGRRRALIGARLPAGLATPRPRSWPRSPRRPGGPAASTTATCATRSATAISTRSARRSRSGVGPARPPTSPTSITARRTRDPPSRCSRWSTMRGPTGLDVTFDTYPSEWASTRLLIQLPAWIQAGGPGPLKGRLAERARPRPAPCRDRGPRRGLHGTRRLGGPPPRGVHAIPTTCAGSRGPWPR